MQLFSGKEAMEGTTTCNGLTAQETSPNGIFKRDQETLFFTIIPDFLKVFFSPDRLKNLYLRAIVFFCNTKCNGQSLESNQESC